MVIVHALLEIKEGTTAKFLEAANKCVNETRKEEGCRFYTLYANSEDPLKFGIFEEWDSMACLDKHKTLPHYLELGANLKDILAKPPAVKVFEASEV